MTATGATVLLKGRKHLSVKDHEPGRITLGFSPWILFAVPELQSEEGRASLGQLEGIIKASVDAAAFTITIDYEPDRILPEHWDIVLAGPEDQAREILEDLSGPA